MSELKVHKFLGRDEVCQYDINHFIGNDYYLKSEADKVIAEKDEKIARLEALRKVHVEAIASMEAGLHQDEKEIRRLKRALYKACAKWAFLAQWERGELVENWEKWEKVERKCRAMAERYMEAK